MKRYISLCCMLVFYCFGISAQSIQPLRINDQVPDISLGKLLNEPSKKIRFSDFKGKLVILDFWNIHCTSCLTSMPKMDSLQKRYADRIQIIYVTRNSAQEVTQLFSRIKTKKPAIPFIVSDTILNTYFTHMGDPYHVWIDMDNKVYALTFDYSTNNTTVSAFLNGLKPRLLRRWDYGIDENYPLISEQNGSLLSLANSYSVFFNSLIEFSSLSSIYKETDSLNRPFLLRLINAPLNMLYNIAFNSDLYKTDVNYFDIPRNKRIIFETKDSSLFFYPSQDSLLTNWMLYHVYNYEIRVSKLDEDTLYKRMQEDLERYLPYTANIEKRSVKCLVFKCTSGKEKVTAEMSSDPSQIIYNGNGTISVQNMPTNIFVMNLIYENRDIATPIIDECGSGCLNMTFESKLSNIKSLNAELQKCGFVLCEETREIDMLIIKDKAIK